MRRILVLVMLLVAAGGDAAAQAPCSLHVEDFGAAPNNGVNDRVSIQTAIDATPTGGVLCFGSGRFDIAIRPGIGIQDVASLKVMRGMTLRGQGAGITVLAMMGSGVRPGATFPGNWDLLQATGGTSAAPIVIEDLTFDGAARFNTGEQTHLWHVIGPHVGTVEAPAVRLERAELILPEIAIPPGSVDCHAITPLERRYAHCDASTGAITGWHGGGDCVFVFGEHNGTTIDERVRGLVIRDVEAPECHRSGIAFQRGTDGVLIEDVEIVNRHDAGVDMEPSEIPGVIPIRNVTMRRMRLSRGGSPAIGYMMAIGGKPGAPSENVTVEDSTILGGSVHVIDARYTVLRRVRVDSSGSEAPTVHARREVVGLRIEDSTLAHGIATSPTPVLLIHAQSGISPTDVTLVNTKLSQKSPDHVIRVESTRSLLLIGGELRYLGPAGTWPLIWGRGVTQPIRSLTLDGVLLVGTGLEGAVHLLTYGVHRPGRITVAGCEAFGLSSYLVRFTGIPTRTPEIVGNTHSAAFTCQDCPAGWAP